MFLISDIIPWAKATAAAVTLRKSTSENRRVVEVWMFNHTHHNAICSPLASWT